MYDVCRRPSSSLTFRVFNLGLSNIGSRGQTYLTFHEKSAQKGEGKRLKDEQKNVEGHRGKSFFEKI